MKHFDITQWTDFARETLTDGDRKAMEAHLSAGCDRCRSALHLVSRVADVARAAGRHEPPDYAVRCAKAIYALQRPETAQAPSLIARLLFDSFQEPLPAGLRAEYRHSRHALYEAGDYSVDLRLEREGRAPLVTLVGQVTNLKGSDASTSRVPILLTTKRDIIAHAISSPFGEFQLEYAPARHLQLHVSLAPNGKRLVLSLHELEAGPSRLPGRPRLRRLGRKPPREAS